MTPPPVLFHALLRPCVLQILRATGYHATRPGVLDLVTEMAARYLELLCQKSATHAALNGAEDAGLNIVDVRMALEEAGALMPEKSFVEQEFSGEEDVRGVEEFQTWFAGPKYKAISELAAVDGEPDINDYLNALKKKHSKTGEDSKYHGTILGKGNDVGEVQVEGGDMPSIRTWEEKMRGPSPARMSLSPASDSRPPSSGLSSVGDRLGDERDNMDLS